VEEYIKRQLANQVHLENCCSNSVCICVNSSFHSRATRFSTCLPTR